MKMDQIVKQNQKKLVINPLTPFLTDCMAVEIGGSYADILEYVFCNLVTLFVKVFVESIIAYLLLLIECMCIKINNINYVFPFLHTWIHVLTT